ncbi:MAG: hypothetical protein AB8G96_10575, partial [Phycisphaerales bacterium]
GGGAAPAVVAPPPVVLPDDETEFVEIEQLQAPDPPNDPDQPDEPNGDGDGDGNDPDGGGDDPDGDGNDPDGGGDDPNGGGDDPDGGGDDPDGGGDDPDGGGDDPDGGDGVTADCNGNGVEDADDIAAGTSQDCNGNGVPDECETLPDTDGDGTPDCADGCPNDPNKSEPGDCGCGTPDTDTDGDGVADCNDGCPNDPNKSEPGDCGCGTPDVDTDGDGVLDCNDGCPDDPNKTEPGDCGCGTPDVDTDGDGVLDCNDGCPNDPNKTDPGTCGCGAPDIDTDGDGVADCGDCNNNGIADDADIAAGTSEDCNGDGVPDECQTLIDSDGDGTPDCADGCPNDPNKSEPGDCGCGTPDTDSDGDGTPDCLDGCPNDPNKVAPGACGCGVADVDSDGDGVLDCMDACPNDPNKVLPGACGCGVADTDSDGDGTPDCLDNCPDDPNKTEPGACGCGVADADSDGDGVLDCNDGCPNDPNKTDPGTCGCGEVDTPNCEGFVDDEGWTTFSPVTGSANPDDDTRILYVSNTGNDTTGYSWYTADSPQVGGDPFNPGNAINAYRTVAHARSFLRDNKPDWLLIERGGTYEESFGIWRKSGRSADEPMLIGAYGDGARPRFLTGASSFVESSTGDPTSFVAFVSLAAHAHTRTVDDTPQGVRWTDNTSQSVLFEDLHLSEFRDNMVLQPYPLTNMIQDVRIRRCVIVDSWSNGSHSQGIFAYDIDGLLIEECILIHNGWNEDIEAAGATIFNRDVYIKDCRDVVTRGNITARGASGGIQQRTGGLSEFNLSIENPIAVSFGHLENSLDWESTGAIRYNVAIDSRDIGNAPRGQAFKVNRTALGVIVEENIVTGNTLGTGSTMGFEIRDSAGTIVRNNIIHDWMETDYVQSWGARGDGILIRGGNTALQINGNLIWQPNGGYGIGIEGGFSSEYAFWDNHYYSTNQANIQHRNPSWLSHAQWASGSGETGMITTEPTFDAGGDGQTPTIAGYLDSIGMDGSVDEFLAAVRQQRKGSWNPALTSYEVITFIRGEFDRETPVPADLEQAGFGG